jgi:uncharacterized protein (DUF305 family)
LTYKRVTATISDFTTQSSVATTAETEKDKEKKPLHFPRKEIHHHERAVSMRRRLVQDAAAGASRALHMPLRLV